MHHHMRVHAADGSLIDPSLTSYSAKKQAGRAEVLKQNRLAAEERWLAKGPGGKPGGKNKEKDDGANAGPGKP